MNIRLPFVLLPIAVGCLLTAVLQAGAFEGRVQYTITEGRQKITMKYAVKSPYLRMDVDMGKKVEESGSMIYDTRAEKMIMLMPSEKMYMEMDVSQVKIQATAKAEEEVTLEKTGRTEEICGYSCSEYLAQTKTEKNYLWLTAELGAFMMVHSPMENKQARQWEKVLQGREFFPLKVIVQDRSGQETYTMVASKVEKKSLPESEFLPPADYSKFEMPSMPGMMPGMPMPGR